MKDSLAALPWCLAYGRLLHSLSLWSWRWSATGLEELKFAFKTRSDSTSERQPITKALQFQILLVASVFRFYGGRSGTDRSDRPGLWRSRCGKDAWTSFEDRLKVWNGCTRSSWHFMQFAQGWTFCKSVSDPTLTEERNFSWRSLPKIYL